MRDGVVVSRIGAVGCARPAGCAVEIEGGCGVCSGVGITEGGGRCVGEGEAAAG